MKGIFSSMFGLSEFTYPYSSVLDRRGRKPKKRQTLKRNNILIIEDDEELLGIYNILKWNHNWPLVMAKNSSEALSHLSRRSFDALILDWNLPDFNGDALVKASDVIYEQHCQNHGYHILHKTPVITFSSEKSVTTNLDYSKYFFRMEHWDKPFNFDKVKGDIESLIYSPTQPRFVEVS